MTPERSPTDVALEPGALLGDRYRLEESIGTGGVAVVWLALDEVLGRRVAVKLLRSESASEEETVQLFRREATAAAGISHTHTVTVYDVGEHDGRPFLVMELIEGPTLADVVDGKGRIPAALVVEIGRQVASALGAGHARGLVHRDVTPSNILFTTDGMTKLTDFGIALLEEPSTDGSSESVFGTVGYLAPEHLAGDEIDARADVFALGVILHECLTGQGPDLADGDSTPRDPRLAAPDVPDALAQLVATATETDPDDRFADGSELAAALEPLGDPELARDALAKLVATGVPGSRRIRSRPRTAPLETDEDADTTQIPTAPLAAASPTAPSDGPSAFATAEPPLSPAAVLSEPVRKPTTEPSRPPPEPRPSAARNLLWLGLGAMAVAAVVAAMIGGAEQMPGADAGQRPDREVPAAGPIEIQGAADFDPHGDGSEHSDEVGAAFDGDRESAWTTERYNTPDLGGLKPGVGIWFDLGEPRPIRLVELDLTAGGGDVELYAFESEPAGDPQQAGPPLARVEGGKGGLRVELDEPVEGRFWLVWFTRVDGGRGGVNEVTFVPR